MSARKERPLRSPGSLAEASREAGRKRRQTLREMRDGGATPVRNDLLPGLRLVHRPPGELTIPARNVRRGEVAQLRGVMASISVFGAIVPVLIDEGGQILDGVVRVEAAREMGLPTIPCIVVGHLDAQERRLLRLTLNRLQERGAWNLDELKIELEELLLDEAPLQVTGFTYDEVDQLLLEEPDAVEPGPIEPSAAGEPVAKLGDVYQLGPHRVVCGDATDPAVIAMAMGEDVATLLLTDEPYNVPIAGHVTGGAHREFVMASGEMTPDAFAAFNEVWMGACLSYLRDGGVLGTFIDWRGYGSVLGAAQAHGLAQLNLIVWSKTNAGMGSLYRSQHELLPLFKKGSAPHVNNVGLGRKGRWRSNVWVAPGASSLGSDARRGLQDHPTVKPVAMLSDALLDLTNRGDVVLDPFLGSGSTLIAAERTGRRCIGIELDPRYVDLILRRYREVTGREATVISDGEVAEHRGNQRV